jgi:hypothetical protein
MNRNPGTAGEPLGGLLGADPRLARWLRAGDHEEDDGVEKLVLTEVNDSDQ